MVKTSINKLMIMFLIMVICVCVRPVNDKVSAATYYTSKEANVPCHKNGTLNLYKIISIKGNKVTYCTMNEKWDEDGVYYTYGKKKTAKLTKKTKYYIGDTKRFNYEEVCSWYMNQSKWIMKSNLSTFKKKFMKTDSSIRVSSGKVKQIYTNIVVAN